MQIITWNVNGLRAALAKGAADWWRTQNADAICLQEIKVQPQQLEIAQFAQLDGYEIVWHPAERKGYSGVATLLRDSNLESSSGLGRAHFDQEGRLIWTRFPDFLLFNIYFPNGQRGHERLQFKLDFYAELLALCERLHAAGEQIILTGDFNTAHHEIDLRNPKQNEQTSGFMPVERAWIDRYLEHGFVDAFRQLYPEREAYTWWTYRLNARQRNIGWRLDYFLVSPGLMARVEDVVIHAEVMGSDHCPVSLFLAV
ncbi:MAG: exodeoxyribonuclease III [Anaerolineales bacterium]|nr:exodeoxyribonuclease III [Anaerolineales bacterium]